MNELPLKTSDKLKIKKIGLMRFKKITKIH